MRKDHSTTTTRYVWDGDQLLLQLDGSGAPQWEFSEGLGVDAPVAVRRSSDGKRFYYQYDESGNVIALWDTTNTQVATYTDDPYGYPIATTGSVAQPLRWKGREYDSETGLYYVRARYYDPTVGRFVSEDPAGLAGGINPYAFGNGDPVNRSDPSGLCDKYEQITWTDKDGNAQTSVVEVVCTEAKESPPLSAFWFRLTSSWQVGTHPDGNPDNYGLDDPNLVMAKMPWYIGGPAGGQSAATATKLWKQLGSQEGVAELLSEGGKAMAGRGTNVPLRDAGRLAEEYGGNARDWVKITSTALGHLQTHAYRNVMTGQVVELKSIIFDLTNMIP